MEEEAKIGSSSTGDHADQRRAQHNTLGVDSSGDKRDTRQTGLEELCTSQQPGGTNRSRNHNNSNNGEGLGPSDGYILALTERSSEFMAVQQMGNDLNRQDKAIKRAAAGGPSTGGRSDTLTNEIAQNQHPLNSTGSASRNHPTHGQERRSGPSAGYILALTERSSEFMTEIHSAGVVDINNNGSSKETTKIMENQLATTTSSSNSNPGNEVNSNSQTIHQEIQPVNNHNNSGNNSGIPLSVPPALHLKERRMNDPAQNNNDVSGTHSRQQQQQQQPGAFREGGINNNAATDIDADDDEETGNHGILNVRNDNSQDEHDAEESHQTTGASSDDGDDDDIEAPTPQHNGIVINNRNEVISPQSLADQILIEATLVASATTTNSAVPTSEEPIVSESFHTTTVGGSSAFAEAKPMDEADMRRSFFKTKSGILLICLLCTMLVLVIGLVVGFTTSTDNNNAISSTANRPSPTLEPIASTTKAPKESLEEEANNNATTELLNRLNLSNATRKSILEDEQSAQHLAFESLREDPILLDRSTKELVQRFSLLTLYHSTDGENWIDSEGWNEVGINPVCSWSKVNCDENEDIYNLNLHLNGLSGTIPIEIWNDILATELQEILMSQNNLKGTIDSRLGEMTSLTGIYLRSNRLSGTLPKELGKIQGLFQVDLVENFFTGPIPIALASNTALKDLELASNSFSGQIPSELFTLEHKDLRTIDLSSNRLSGTLPQEIWKAPRLTALYIGMNGFSGSLPSQIGAMQSINHFDAKANRFSGGIPSEVGLATSLRELNLGMNDMSGLLPSEVGYLYDLCEFSIPNNRLSGTIPPEAGQLCYGFVSPNTSSSGQEIHVRGEYWFDHSIETSKALEYLNTTLADSVQATFDGLEFFTTTLQRKIPNDWQNNYFVVITAFFSGATATSYYDLRDLLLAVAGRVIQIETKDTETNQTILGSASFGLSWGANFRPSFINFSYNNFSGSIPAELFGSGSLLGKLDLSSNFLSGHIPSAVGFTPDLESLVLANNSLNGNIPSEVGSLSQLTALDISANRIQGAIPSSLGYARSLNKLDVSNNLLGGSIPLELVDLHDLREIDLSQNQITGSIPNFKFQRIESVNFSFNAFTGNIPANLLHTVCRADMSHNQLSGTLSKDTSLACYRDIHFGMCTVSALLEVKLGILDPFFVASEQQIGYVEHVAFNAALLYDRVLKDIYPSDFESISMVYSKVHYSEPDREILFDLIAAVHFVAGSTLPASQEIAEILTGANFQQHPLEAFELNISSAAISIDSLPPVQLDLSFNKLSGTIPKELAALGSPGSVLRLQGNHFTGSLPEELCPWLCASRDANSSRLLEVDCEQITCSCDCRGMGG